MLSPEPVNSTFHPRLSGKKRVSEGGKQEGPSQGCKGTSAGSEGGGKEGGFGSWVGQGNLPGGAGGNLPCGHLGLTSALRILSVCCLKPLGETCPGTDTEATARVPGPPRLGTSRELPTLSGFDPLAPKPRAGRRKGGAEHVGHPLHCPARQSWAQ